jgi:hypothetical protein
MMTIVALVALFCLPCAATIGAWLKGKERL